jgi:hypothetical protein
MAKIRKTGTHSYIPDQNKGKNPKPEMIVKKYLFARGFRSAI